MTMLRAKSGFQGHYLPVRPVSSSRPDLVRSEAMLNRIGLHDTILTSGPDGEAKMGIVSKISKVYKERIDDGAEWDQCGDPLYFFVGVTIHPDDVVLRMRPPNVKLTKLLQSSFSLQLH